MSRLLLFAIALALSAPASPANAAELLRDFGGPAGFGEGALEPNDDNSTGERSLLSVFPNGIPLGSEVYDSMWVNNNGTVTFDGPRGSYSPSPIPISDAAAFYVYWGDVDTRNRDLENLTHNLVYYHISEADEVVVVTWYRVGYFSSHNDLQNSFQLILSPLPDGEVSVEMRYERCEWTTGDANQGSGGFGGSPALVGLNSGNSEDFWSYENSLNDDVIEVCDDSNTGVPGYWRFDLSAEGAVLDRSPRCGNGVVGDTYGEVCDDGNLVDGDGCSARCFYEAEYFPYDRKKLSACAAGAPGAYAGLWSLLALLIARRRTHQPH